MSKWVCEKVKAKLFRRCEILILLLVLVVGQPPVSAAQHAWGASYLDWSGALLSDTSSVSQVIQPLEISPNMYWEAGWFWNNAPDGAYGGIQTKGILANGQISDLAIFSIWNATAAIPGPDAGCTTFGGEGIGYSCRIATPIVAGNKYEIAFSVDVERGPQWWKATIKDFDKGTTRLIGSIAAPAAGLRATNWNNFIEYWGPAVPCDSVGLATARFYLPQSTNPDIQFSSPMFSRPSQVCVNSAGDTPPTGYVGDAIIRFGGARQAASTQSLPGVKSRALLAKEKVDADNLAKLNAEAQAAAEAAARMKRAIDVCNRSLPKWNEGIFKLNIYERENGAIPEVKRLIDELRKKYGVSSTPFDLGRCTTGPDEFGDSGRYNFNDALRFATETINKINPVLYRISQEAEKASSRKKPTTITCVKGKLVKKVTGINPKCPSGYVKK